MSNLKLNVNAQRARQISTVFKVDTKIILIKRNHLFYLIADKTDFFKAVLIPIEFDNTCEDFAYYVNKSILTCLTNEGTTYLDITNGTFNINYMGTDNNTKIISKGLGTFIPTSQVSEYLSLLDLKERNLFQTNVLDDLKSLICICKTSGDSLVIDNNLIYTSSRNLKIYIENSSSDLGTTLGLSSTVLTELDKFKFSGNVKSIRNYLVLNRDGFILAVRKSNVKSTHNIPEEFRNDTYALGSYIIDTDNMVNFLSHNDYMFKSKFVQFNVELDLGNNTFTLDTGSEVHKILLPSHSLKEGADKSISSVNLSIDDLMAVSSLLALKNTKKIIFIYKNLIRLQIGKLNILMRYHGGL